MNNVVLSGRFTRDPEIRYTSSQTCVASFTLTVDRHDKEKHKDFPRVKAFGRLAEIVEKYCKQGKPIEVTGQIQTGSYDDKDGNKVYTTDVVAQNIIFVYEPQAKKEEAEQGEGTQHVRSEKTEPEPEPTQEQFEALDDDVPF